MPPLISFVDEGSLQSTNWYAKVYEFVNHDKKERNFHSIAAFLSSNVLVDIKVVPILASSLDDKICWGFSQDSRFSLKSSTWAPIVEEFLGGVVPGGKRERADGRKLSHLCGYHGLGPYYSR